MESKTQHNNNPPLVSSGGSARFEVVRGGSDEPGLILVLDNCTGYAILRGSDMVLDHIKELVRMANVEWKAPNERISCDTKDQ